MKRYIETVYSSIHVGDRELDRRYSANRVVMKFEGLDNDAQTLGLTQSQALELAASLLDTVANLQSEDVNDETGTR